MTYFKPLDKIFNDTNYQFIEPFNSTDNDNKDSCLRYSISLLKQLNDIDCSKSIMNQNDIIYMQSHLRGNKYLL